MVKPTLFQKVLRRPSQRYTSTTSLTPTDRTAPNDYHSTKDQLLRIAADLDRDVPNDDTYDQPAHHAHDRGISGEFSQVTTSAAVALPLSTSPTTGTSLVADTCRDVPSTERRTPGEQNQDNFSDDNSDTFFTPDVSPSTTSWSPSPAQTPSTTPSNSAASSTASLVDFVRSSTSLPDHATLSTANMIAPIPDPRIKRVHDRKLTYTDEDWAKDVRWLVAPQIDRTSAKHKGKAEKRRSAPPTVSVIASRSASSLSNSMVSSNSLTNPGRLASANPYAPPSAHPPPRSHNKAKIGTARTVIGMSALMEVEEDMEPEPGYSEVVANNNKLIGRKRSSSSSHPRERARDRSSGNHEPPVSSPLRPHRLTRQRSSSSPSLLLAGGETTNRSSFHHPVISNNASQTKLSTASNPRHAFGTVLRPLSEISRVTSSTTKSPYTSAAPNVLDALAAHVSVSHSHDTLPSTGTRGYTSLVLPRAATSPTLGIDQGTKRLWKLNKGRSTGATVRDSIGAGLGLGDQVDLTRPGLARTTMASVEVVRGIAAGSGADMKSSKLRGNFFGVGWFSKDKEKSLSKGKGKGKTPQDKADTPLGFTAYRAPPVYVGGGSILVQVWGVGLEGTDARLVGIHPTRPEGPSLPDAPYGTKALRPSEKEKVRHAPVGYIPGRSFVGRVLEVGWEVGEEVAKRGDWVVGLMNVHKCGALAEFILADRHRVHRVPQPFMPSRFPFSLVPTAGAADDLDGDEPSPRNSPMFPPPEEDLTVNELALLPLCGVPAYRAVRTFHHITTTMGNSQLLYDNSHNEIHPLLPPRSDRQDFTAGGGEEGFIAQGRPWDSRPRALVLRAHDGPGAFAAQMLVHEGWSVWAHVPVPFMLPGPTSDVADDLKDEEEEKELEKRRSTLRRIEERLRGWGVDEVLFVSVTSMPLSSLFAASNMALEAMSSWSPPSIHMPYSSSSSSPSISPSPFSRSTTSSPLSSHYSHPFSSDHFSSTSSPSSSSHQNAFTTPYSFTPLPLASYNCEQSSVVSLMSYLSRSRVRLDAILDTIGGREIWEAGRSLLSRVVRDPLRQDVDAQFTTLVGDTPDRVVSTAGDNFRAGVRSLRLGGAKDQHAFEDSGYHEAVTHGHGKEKKSKLKPRPVNYSWVNIVSDIDWEGSDVHDTLCAVLRMATSEGVKPAVGSVDFPNCARKDKGKRRAMFGGADSIKEELRGKVVPFENTPDVFLAGGGLDYGGTIVSRIAG
ncbi:hypothetical protein PAXRUDRAFT_129831 [Paxillus rubicundulus Ve08.2h10]|uniref:Uncharacterized protein n=1 Tax=Paxillus rubicundulus Ve08.2h10 TaxID=930991 RepID=A0A0D0DNK1_9AGAM|nr:hypothetical protein PAXRUDRAFT_129831 [Paxillus rubicundulus Ve08.2h10]